MLLSTLIIVDALEIPLVLIPASNSSEILRLLFLLLPKSVDSDVKTAKLLQGRCTKLKVKKGMRLNFIFFDMLVKQGG